MHKINLTAAQNKILEKAKITCAEQLIRQMPNRYDDCRQVFVIESSIIDQTVSIIGILSSVSSKSTTRIPKNRRYVPDESLNAQGGKPRWFESALWYLP